MKSKARVGLSSGPSGAGSRLGSSLPLLPAGVKGFLQGVYSGCVASFLGRREGVLRR